MENFFKKIYYLLGGKKGGYFQQKWSKYKINREFNRKVKNLHGYGLVMLRKYFEVCSERNVKAWLEYGTLLGAVRENSFIPHDFDLDVGMYASDYTDEFHSLLVKKGFKKNQEFYLVDVQTNCKTITEVTYTYNSLSIDIFLSSPIDEAYRAIYVYAYNNPEQMTGIQAKRFRVNTVEPLEDVSINGKYFKSPKNPKQLLSQIYGPNYMIPNPNWKPTKKNTEVVTWLNNACEYGERILF